MPSNEVVMDGVHCASLLECKRSGSQYALTVNGHGAHREEECTHNPNMLVYKKMEAVIESMQDQEKGVPIKTVNSFINKIPSVFTGADLVTWLSDHLPVQDPAEALHFASLLASHGYLFPIDDHILTVKNDSNSLYRFQTRYFWPSNCWSPENTDYAVYLCKRTMQNKARLELADYEAENLARLQKMFSRKWEFIFMQAEAQSKVDKKRDKQERKILDTQERAFWDVYRPPPGQINTTEMDIKKMYRLNQVFGQEQVQVGERAMITQLKRKKHAWQSRKEKRTVRVSKCGETYIDFFKLYEEYDPLLYQAEWSSPWISEVWEREGDRQACDIQPRRVQRWAFSGWELLKDPSGRDHFLSFLEKEYATENLLFVEAVWQLKKLSSSEVAAECSIIWSEFMGPQAEHPVNVDSKSYKITEENMRNPDRWTFDIACAHLYYLMTSDSYSRYIRSSHYKEFLDTAKKKSVKSFTIPKLSSAKQNIINAKSQIKDGLTINSF